VKVAPSPAELSPEAEPREAYSKPALDPAREPQAAGLNSSQPRPWAELQGDGPGGCGGWVKEQREDEVGAGGLEGLEARKRGPFIGTGQKEPARSTSSNRTPAEPSLVPWPPGRSLGAAPTH
jgi:hypothetical protein